MSNMFRTGILLVLGATLMACSSAEDRAVEYLERAQVSFEAGDYVKAELDVKNALQIDPRNVEARVLMYQLAEKQQKWREMFRNLQRVVNLDPDNVDARIKLGRLHLMGQNSDEAAEQADAALRLAPDNLDARVLHASVLYTIGDREAGIAEAQEVLDEDPTSVAAVSFLASAYANDEPDRALAILSQGIEAQPDNAALRMLKVRILQRTGRTEEMEQEYRKLVEQNPADTALAFNLATYYEGTGRLDEAEAILTELVKENPDNVTVRLRLAQFVGNNRSTDKAEELLARYIKENPEVYEYRFALAQVYTAAGRGENSEGVLRKIIDTDGTGPNGLEARNKLAATYLRESRMEEGKQLIDEVLAEDPANTNALLMTAMLDLQQKETQRAITSLRTVLRNEPQSERTLLLLSQAHLQANSPSLAQETFRKLVEAHPANAEGRKGLARLLVRERKHEEARRVLQAGVAQHPNDLQMARLLSDTLMTLNDWDAAEEQAQRILALDENAALGHYVKGRVLFQQEDFEGSIAAFRRSLEIEPAALESLSGMVRGHVRADDLKGAETYLIEYNKQHPNNVHGRALLAEIHARQQRWNDAIAMNEEALALNAKWIPAYRNLIGVHFELGQLPEAQAVVERGLQELPNNIDLRLLLANLHERQGRFDEAIAIYEAEVKQNPNLDVAANNFAALVADHQATPERMQAALSYVSRFKDSENPIFLDTLGWLHYRMGNIDKAVPLLERAVERAGDQVPQLRYHLGMAYYTADQLDAARRELQAAVGAEGAAFSGLDEARSTLELL